jgi:hypothetical protein
MTRAFVFRNFSVYVLRERGGRHHRAHAHIKEGAQRVASVFLETMEMYDVTARIPKQLCERLEEEQEALVALWIELNEDE